MEVARPTINQALVRFLAEQRARLGGGAGLVGAAAARGRGGELVLQHLRPGEDPRDTIANARVAEPL